ncbi:MAG: type II toxin-antitoxin system MqsA family antitoxin [Janthinobacterium lividum]
MAHSKRVAERPCHECGQIMRRDVRDFTITYQGLSSTFPMPGWYCTGAGCEEAIADSEDMKVSSRELHILKAKAANLLAAAEVRRVRKTLGLTQREAGLVLGGGPNAFQKYENAELVPSKAISNLLRVLEVHPSALEILRRESQASETSPATNA